MQNLKGPFSRLLAGPLALVFLFGCFALMAGQAYGHEPSFEDLSGQISLIVIGEEVTFREDSWCEGENTPHVALLPADEPFVCEKTARVDVYEASIEKNRLRIGRLTRHPPSSEEEESGFWSGPAPEMCGTFAVVFDP